MKPANAMTETCCEVRQHKLRLVTSRVSMILQATYVYINKCQQSVYIHIFFNM